MQERANKDKAKKLQPAKSKNKQPKPGPTGPAGPAGKDLMDKDIELS
jgi:hypothetical protein